MKKKIVSLIAAIMMTVNISTVSLSTVQFTDTVTAFAMTADSLFENNNIRQRTPEEIRKYIEEHPAVYVDHDYITVDGQKYAQSIDGGGLSFYQDTYDEEPVVEKGNYAPGKLSEKSLQHALNALNIERYIAGLNEVALSNEYNTMCQTGSLVNAANGVLSHYPEQPEGMDDAMYKTGYSGTSSSNLAMYSMGYSGMNSPYAKSGKNTLGYAVIHQWMSDADSSNIDRLGHRRWCLNPSMEYTGFGSVRFTGEETYSGYTMTTETVYTSMYSFDNSFGARNTKYMVSWPAANMPVELFGKNEPWSFTTGRNFTSATTVTLTRESDGKAWVFAYGTKDGYFNVDNQGFGQGGCICFRPNDIEDYKGGDVFTVKISDGAFTKEYQVSFFALHNYKTTLVKEPTCTEYGTEKVTCTGCGESFMHRIPMTTHTIKDTVIKPTCTSYGYTKHKCTVCGYEKSNTDYTSPLGHDYKDTVIKPTCTEMGHTLHECSRCKKTYTSNYVSSLGHDFVKTNEVPYTCTEDGYTVMSCTRCNESYKTNIFHTPGHSFGNWTTTKAATCTAQGTQTRTCSMCKITETKSIAALGHTWGEPTYTWSDDNTKCTAKRVCGNDASHVEVETINVTSKVKTPPSCAENGTTTYSAEFNNNVFAKQTKDVNDIPKTSHIAGTAVKENEKPATCIEAGSYDEVVYCAECHAEISRTTKKTEALGHSWGEWTVTTPATEDAEGVETRTCEFCGETETRSIPKLEKLPALYSFTETAKEWSKDSSESMTLTIHRSSDDDKTFENFKCVEVDGEVVSPENYIAESGSLILTFKPEYLTSLSEGEHTVKVIFTDGEAEASLTISAPSAPEYILGDANGDRAITVTDISKVAAHVKGIKSLSEEEQKRADANGDGSITVTDISKIAAHVKGIKSLN